MPISRHEPFTYFSIQEAIREAIVNETKVKTAASVLTAARRALATAELGYADMTGDVVLRRLPGMHNLLTFFRSVTFVLQNLRGIVDGFDDWYHPYVTEMKEAPTARRFLELRNELEKEGTTHGVGNSLQINYLNTDDLQPLLQNPRRGQRASSSVTNTAVTGGRFKWVT